MQGDFSTALASYRAALDLFEADRGKLQDEASRSGYFANKLSFDIGRSKSCSSRATSRGLRSVRALEVACAGDLLASRDISFPTEQERSRFAGLMEQRGKVAGLQSNLFALLAQNRPEAEIARARADVAAAEQRYQTILKQIEGSAGKARDLVVAKPATLAQLAAGDARAGLRDPDVSRRPERVDPVASQRRRRTHPQRLHSPARIERQGASLYDSLADRKVGFDAETARELYLFLVAPARPWIRSRRLVIIPSAELHQVPFEALQNPADGRFLGEEFELSYASSATVLLGHEAATQPADGALLAVADPEFKAEVEAVAALYPGRATIVGGATLATKKDGVSRLADYDVVHLSVHGEFNGRQPLLSHLKLGPTDRDDGRLTAAEMFGLPLDPPASWC